MCASSTTSLTRWAACFSGLLHPGGVHQPVGTLAGASLWPGVVDGSRRVSDGCLLPVLSLFPFLPATTPSVPPAGLLRHAHPLPRHPHRIPRQRWALLGQGEGGTAAFGSRPASTALLPLPLKSPFLAVPCCACCADVYLVKKSSSTLAAAIHVGTPLVTEERCALRCFVASCCLRCLSAASFPFGCICCKGGRVGAAALGDPWDAVMPALHPV